jgi:hypothetical protein
MGLKRIKHPIRILMEGSVHICQNQISVQKWTQISVSGFEIPRIQRSDLGNRETKKPKYHTSGN